MIKSTDMGELNKKTAKILVFSTEKISDPAIDMAGLLKLHYPPTVYTISIPCLSGIKPSWIMYAYEKGFDGVFIAADGSDCVYGETCTEKTGHLVGKTHNLMKENGIEPARLRMAAICSVCSESFVKQIRGFNEYLLKTLHT
jgi:F420-non-reducing hydrogenase iron-sulfur subunit